MEALGFIFLSNLASVVAMGSAAYILITKGYVDGVGWLIFASICLSSSTNIRGK
jgi:hypothetical protein